MKYGFLLVSLCALLPLKAVEPGTLGLRLRGGVAPTLFNGRDETYVVSCLLTPPVQSLGKLPQSKELFEVPAYLAGEVTYALFDCVTVFGEVIWRHASGKDFCQTLETPQGPFTFTSHLSNASAVGGYFGSRLYCGEFWRMEPYIGMKIGVLNHHEICGTIKLNDERLTTAALFLDTNVLSAGFQVGLDIGIFNCMKLVVQAEIVASAGPKSNRNIEILFPKFPLSSINVANIETDIMFPITAGLVYEF